LKAAKTRLCTYRRFFLWRTFRNLPLIKITLLSLSQKRGGGEHNAHDCSFASQTETSCSIASNHLRTTPSEQTLNEEMMTSAYYWEQANKTETNSDVPRPRHARGVKLIRVEVVNVEQVGPPVVQAQVRFLQHAVPDGTGGYRRHHVGVKEDDKCVERGEP
jgi:hypothetical protein